MSNSFIKSFGLSIALMLSTTIACSVAQTPPLIMPVPATAVPTAVIDSPPLTPTDAGPPTETPATQPVQPTPADEPTAAVLDPTPAGSGGDGTAAEIHQWATGASATSQLDDAHSAAEAAGDPGVEWCDFNGYSFNLRPNAWASRGENTVETLTLNYATPVIPTKITIHQVFIPNAVTNVDVIDVSGAEHIVYTGPPYDLDVCPYLMQIDVLEVTAKVQTVIITLDQSVMGRRNEINAVELVGRP